MKRYDTWLSQILNFLPEAEVCEDNEGQLIIYTAMKMDSKDYVIPMPIDERTTADSP